MFHIKNLSIGPVLKSNTLLSPNAYKKQAAKIRQINQQDTVIIGSCSHMSGDPHCNFILKYVWSLFPDLWYKSSSGVLNEDQSAALAYMVMPGSTGRRIVLGSGYGGREPPTYLILNYNAMQM